MDFQDVYNLFFVPGEVVEIRSYGLNGKGPWEGFAKGEGVVYGYFDNAEAFAAAARALDGARAPAVYFTLNPVLPDFLARAANRLKAFGSKAKTTSDKNIACVRWLPLDFDPARMAGDTVLDTDIPTTDEELRAAWELRNRVGEWLREEIGAPAGVPAISGNGAHLLYRLPDLPNTEETHALVRRALYALAEKFGSATVDIDVKVSNAARIWKLYGTTARKGDPTDRRPHRKSYIHDKFMLTDIPVTSTDALERLAATES